MKFKKQNGKFYVNGEEFTTFDEAWAEIKDKIAQGDFDGLEEKDSYYKFPFDEEIWDGLEKLSIKR